MSVSVVLRQPELREVLAIATGVRLGHASAGSLDAIGRQIAEGMLIFYRAFDDIESKTLAVVLSDLLDGCCSELDEVQMLIVCMTHRTLIS